jgi:hypothetical protein
MATSGSYDYSRTAAQVIQAAYENIGVVAPGGTVVSADSTMALARLNVVAKRLRADPLLAAAFSVDIRKRVTLFLAKGQQTYLIGPASTDARATTQYGRTTVSSAYASGTSLSVTAITDTTTFPGTTVSMTSADFIGVVLNDGTISWDTLNGTPGSSPVTLTSGLSGAAAAGNYVYWFTSRAQRIPAVEAAVLRTSSLTDTELGMYRDVRGYELGVADKYADGSPTTVLVEPVRLNTRVTLNSQPTDVTQQIVLTGLYPAEDYDATTDDISLPQEHLDLIQWELGLALAPAKGRPWTKEMDMCLTRAWTAARALNPEMSDLSFQSAT